MTQTRTGQPAEDEAWDERGTVVVPPDRELPPEGERGSGEPAPAQPIVTEPAPPATASTPADADPAPAANAASAAEPAAASASMAAADSPIEGGGEVAPTPLFDTAVADALRGRWTDVQVGFVDEPRRAVEQADALVADVLGRLTDGFAAERQSLEQQWTRGDDVSTEDLRMALRRYRSFFDRLLSI